MRGCMCWDVDVYTKAREGARVARGGSARGKKTVELAKGRQAGECSRAWESARATSSEPTFVSGG